jgi:hypothetical protein
MTRRADRPDPGDAQAAAAYIAELSASLAALARTHGFDALCYLLEMARDEARILSGGNGAADQLEQ